MEGVQVVLLLMYPYHFSFSSTISHVPVPFHVSSYAGGLVDG